MHPKFIRDDLGDRVLVDGDSGVRMLTEDSPDMWSTHLVGSCWTGWVAFARLILAADETRTQGNAPRHDPPRP